MRSPSNIDPSLLEPKEEFDVIGPGQPGEVAPVAKNDSQDKAKPKRKGKEELRKWHYWMARLR